MRFSVVLTGTMRGMQREGACEVLATRQVESGGIESISDLRLLNAPRGWPDGDYIAEFHGTCARVVRRRGEWHIEKQLAQDGCENPEKVSEI